MTSGNKKPAGRLMNVLLIAIQYPVCSARYAYDALVRLGHDARVSGPHAGAGLWGQTVDERYIWTPPAPEDDWAPELLIIMDAHLPGDVAEGYTCPVVVYGVDSHVRSYAQYKADRFFLAHQGVCLRPWDAACEHLLCGYDPNVFTPGKPWRARQYDAALIGVLYNRRAELLYAILEALPAQVRIAYGTGPVYDEYAGIYQDARISLVSSTNGDMAMRLWETAAMGCLLLTDWCPDMDGAGLEDGENCLVYTSPQDAAGKVRWVLEHPDEAEQIALAGQQWAQSGTWDARLQRIVDWAEAQNAPMKREKVTKNGTQI